MDSQPTPSFSASPEGRPGGGARPEDLQVSAPERSSQSEPGPTGASPGSVAPTAAPSKLSPADVAAAIEAVPGPSGAAAHVSSPSVAGDVDVIEPEWVDQAEDVVRTHQGDPYGEEEAVEALQRDYLEKRYGHRVADPKADAGKTEGA